MKAGSLCTGIGGLDLAVEAHFGAELAWYAEVEPAPCTVLEREWPGVPNLGDLTAVDWSSVEPVDVISAGYPCQPFSHAGKRKGADDVRHLWPHVAEAVRVLRPRWVVLENVAGHLSLGFGDVLRDLAEAGFDAEWCVLRASDVGAPHQRARLFIVATDADRSAARRDSGAAPRPQEPDGGRGEANVDHGPSHEDRDAASNPGGERHGGGQDAGAVGRVDRGDAGEARQRERARPVPGDRSSPALADAADLGYERGGSGRRRGDGPADSGDAVADAASERRSRREEPRSNVERDGLQPALMGAGGGPRHPYPPVKWGQYEPAIRRWELTLGRPAPRPTDDAGRLSPAFVEWMMGYPQGWVDGLTRTQALKALGNAVVPQQGIAALAELASLEERAA